jgi:hypothetical protein
MTTLTRQTLAPNTLIISSSLGLDPNTVEMLLGENIRTIGELLALDEVTACQMLVEDDLGYGMSNQLAHNAVQRFMELRGRLDQLGHGFAGLRRTESYLFEQAF